MITATKQQKRKQSMKPDDPISLDVQVSTNISWFGIDLNGNIASFESCGFAWIHPSVLESESNRRQVLQYFKELEASQEPVIEGENFRKLNVSDDPDEYLESASFFSKRGLFVYDVPLTPKRDTIFIRLCRPQRPLTVFDVPRPVKDILSPIRMDVIFDQASEFHPVG